MLLKLTWIFMKKYYNRMVMNPNSMGGKIGHATQNLEKNARVRTWIRMSKQGHSLFTPIFQIQFRSILPQYLWGLDLFALFYDHVLCLVPRPVISAVRWWRSCRRGQIVFLSPPRTVWRIGFQKKKLTAKNSPQNQQRSFFCLLWFFEIF